MPKTVQIADKGQFPSGIENSPLGEEVPKIIKGTTGEFTGDVDHNNNYALGLQNIPDLLAKGQGYHFDGVNDDVSIPNTTAIVDVDDMSIIISVKFNELLAVADTAFLLGKGIGGTGSWGVQLQNSAIQIGIRGTENNLFSGGNVEVGKHYNISGVFKGINSFLDINGVVTTGDLSGHGYIFTTDDITMGINRINGNEAYLNAEIYKSFLFNLALTETEVKAFSSGAPVPFKYLGAIQTDILSGWDFTSGWATIVATISDSNTFVSTQVGGAVYKNCELTLGKSYRICIAGTVSTGNLEVRLGGTGDQIIYDGLSGTFDETIEFTCEYLGELRLRCTVSSSTVDITTLELTQIGCVLQLEQPGIGNNQWLDNSGNNLNGTVSGAIPTNLPQNHIEKFKHSTAITGDTTWTSIIPIGYELTKIIFVESGGTASTIDLGTTSGTSDVFANQVIEASSITTVIIQKTFSMSAVQSLYLNDDDGSSLWGVGTSIIATLFMERG